MRKKEFNYVNISIDDFVNVLVPNGGLQYICTVSVLTPVMSFFSFTVY